MTEVSQKKKVCFCCCLKRILNAADLWMSIENDVWPIIRQSDCWPDFFSFQILYVSVFIFSSWILELLINLSQQSYLCLWFCLSYLSAVSQNSFSQFSSLWLCIEIVHMHYLMSPWTYNVAYYLFFYLFCSHWWAWQHRLVQSARRENCF